MVRRRLLAAAVLVAFSALMWPAWTHFAHAEEPDDHNKPKEIRTDQGRRIAANLMCQCGCGLTVAACRDSMTCSMAAGLAEQIERQVAAGKSDSEIKNYFVSVYGEQILAMPTKSGFNLAAWTTPFLGVGTGGLALFAVVWFWVRRRPGSAEEAPAASEGGQLSAYEERVDREILSME